MRRDKDLNTQRVEIYLFLFVCEKFKFTGEKLIMKPKRSKEIASNIKKIDGWFSNEAALLFGWIDEIQKENKITGDIFEIGCHHGKSAVFLGEMLNRENEKFGVCDLFGSQDSNISASGHGDLSIFKKNINHLTSNNAHIEIHIKNSSQLTVDEIGSNFRFFHIDGGHNCEEALADLQLAGRSIIDAGIIVLDDPFRHEWPGVTEALFYFLIENQEFSAIFAGFNKILIVKNKFADFYFNQFNAIDSRDDYGLGYPIHMKQLPFNKRSIQIMYVPSYLKLNGALTSIKKIVRKMINK